MLGLLSAPEVWQEGRPDTHQDAEGDGRDVVGGGSEQVDELQHDADRRDRKQPLPIVGHEQEVEGDAAAKVVVKLICEILRHEEPWQPTRLHLGDQVGLVQREVGLQVAPEEEVADVDAGAVLVLGGDHVVDEVDLVRGLEDRVRVRVVVLGVRLVDVGDHPAVPVPALWPAGEVMAELGVRVEVLRLELQLVFQPGCDVPELLRGRADLDEDLVAVSAVVAEEPQPAVREALEVGLPTRLPHEHRLPSPLCRLAAADVSDDLIPVVELHILAGLALEDHAHLVASPPLLLLVELRAAEGRGLAIVVVEL
mmetsp:Transcript_68881/g.193232  ORF Transcript_68881/g.193232 Transcript_68881/m.193232 type:complete len:310 (-) Transcript_68881:116-1045(-)